MGRGGGQHPWPGPPALRPLFVPGSSLPSMHMHTLPPGPTVRSVGRKNFLAANALQDKAGSPGLEECKTTLEAWEAIMLEEESALRGVA